MMNVLSCRAVRSSALPSFLLLAMAWAGATYAQPGASGTPSSTLLAIDGVIEGEKSGPAENVSGISCARPRPSGQRTCIMVDDEVGFAQRVTLDGNVLRAGSRASNSVPILTRLDDPEIRGRRPTGLGCPVHTGKFTQLDGEGIAFQETGADGSGFFYVSGSHGCSRNSGEERPSQFILARIPYDAATDRFGAVVRTWRLSEALHTAAILGPRFGHPLDNTGGDGGLDIEGIAVDRDRLLVGFRAPNIDGRAFILPVPLGPLFATEWAVVPEQPIELPLERQEGIRDLASMADGRVLVLTGPAPDKADVQPRLMAFDPRIGAASLVEIAKLPAPESNGAKYEGVTFLEQGGGAVSVVIVQDGPSNGRPTRYQFSIPHRSP
ncbi:DUF3616 domain-containing protein [Roseomonas nepalensis]|uniref:DUF3616 domain-containing protein n=1 Tax=Muricoccus nepalensis TaxID=1854500 RepID=A0A502FW34_9PROT|nr:DUF3616 domain-containing protein [Roseomonas nepalensis]TPG53639.1 DUF3616 domain-containing protein [Roseomonas nepalensis]